MDSYIGTIIAFAGDYEPENWKCCNGQTINISGYEPLYSLIGTTYGGNGTTNFALPDLRNRLVIGAGTGTGLSTYALGAAGGADQVTLTASQIPAHSHTLTATKDIGTSSTPDSTSVLGAISDTNSNFYDLKDDTTNPVNFKTLNSVSITSTGGNLPHENRQPFMAINYIICVNGIYPSFD